MPDRSIEARQQQAGLAFAAASICCRHNQFEGTAKKAKSRISNRIWRSKRLSIIRTRSASKHLEKSLPRTIYKSRYDSRAARALVAKLSPDLRKQLELKYFF